MNPFKSIFLGLTCCAIAACSHDEHDTRHEAQNKVGGSAADTAVMESLPREVGQSAFATIAEMVGLLEHSPATDWSLVDIATLREHLVDMDRVTLQARVVATNTEMGAAFEVTGTPPVQESIRRMLHAHAGILGNTGAAESDGKSDWTWKVTDTAGGVILSVGAVDAADIQKIRALGLHGLLVYGVHHQAHHWLMASGRNPHAH